MLGRAPISGVAISGNRAPFIPQVTGGGGWILEAPAGRGKKERVREERERLGIIPKAVEKVIAKVVEQQIALPERNLDAALHRALERKNLAYKALYAEVVRLEMARQVEALESERIALKRQRDEDEILILLLH